MIVLGIIEPFRSIRPVCNDLHNTDVKDVDTNYRISLLPPTISTGGVRRHIQAHTHTHTDLVTLHWHKHINIYMRCYREQQREKKWEIQRLIPIPIQLW